MTKQIKNFKELINKMDKPLLIATILFFIFGLLSIATASSREAVVRYEVSTFYYFFKQLKMLLIGLVLSCILINLRTKSYKFLIPFVSKLLSTSILSE